MTGLPSKDLAMPPATGERSDARVWGALGIVYVLWGSTYLGMAVVVETVPAFLGMGTRFALSALILAALISVLRGPRALAVSRTELAWAALIGVMLLVFGNGVVALSEQYVPSGVAALVVAITPVVVAVLRRATGDIPSRATTGGVIVGFAGVAALVVVSSRRTGSLGTGYEDVGETATFLWTLLIVGAAVSWAVGSFISARLSRAQALPRDPLVMTFWQFVAGAAGLLLMGAVTGERLPPVTEWGARATTAWLFLVAAGVLAFLSYTWLLANARLSLVATYAYVNPVVAVVLGWWIKGESLTPAVVACAALVLIGVASVVRGEQRPRSTAEDPGTVANSSVEREGRGI